MATPDNKDGREKSAFVVFWSSLPGILTGVAAVIGAVAALTALFLGNHGGQPGTSGGSTASEPPAAPSTPGPTVAAPTASSAGPNPVGAGCLLAYFKAIPHDRITPVEAGTDEFEVIGPTQSKSGPFGLRLTSSGRAIGALRLAYFPVNDVFKIESIVDGRCRTGEEYANTTHGGDKHVLQNDDTLRLHLGGAFYTLRFHGSSTIRVNFDAFVP